MPELPEVETTRRGVERLVLGRQITGVHVRQPRLRWPVTARLEQHLEGQRIEAVARRGKYLLVQTARGTVILHLGMSGSLRVLGAEVAAQPHDHVDIVLDKTLILRLRDPRRFGAVLWAEGDALTHPLLRALGPEPLDEGFDGDYLYRSARGRRVAVKDFLMNSRVVAGIGNIYANEALFLAGIRPLRAAGRISLARYRHLAGCIKQVLARAVDHGGTTLRDFSNEDGKPGYFRHALQVYGKAGQACRACGGAVRLSVVGQRSTFYCVRCQR